MPQKRIKKPKQKPKQKQKQKQIVKQNVKVTVQSSGGSGGGGTPSYLPQQYTDTRTLGLLDEISKAIRSMPASSRAPALYQNTPANDVATVNAVFSAPINTNKPVELGLNNERPIARKKPKKVQAPVSSSESEVSMSPFSGSEGYGSEGYASSGGEKQPIGRSMIYEESARNLLRTYAPPSLMAEVISGMKERASGASLFDPTGNY
jgi:hypothetical protein